MASNELIENCYCSKPRNTNEIEIQCCGCSKWFHRSCLSIETGILVKFLINYQFYCKNCGNGKQESFIKKQASFHQMVVTTLANLLAEQRNNQSSKQHFSKDRDIIPFIEKNWEFLTNAPRRTKSTWHATISRTMTRDDVFMTKTENSELLYGLRDGNLEKIGPLSENNSANLNTNVNNGSFNNRRGSKRKASEASSYSGNSGAGGASGGNYNSLKPNKGSRNDLSRLEKMVPLCYPLDHPFNKDGYRYHLVEPDPHSPMRQKFEETELWAGKPLPGHLYRLFVENRVAFALHDRAPQLKLSEDRMCVTGEKGYSMVRATHGVSNGSWYFEVTIKDKPNSSALRIGWAQQLANLQAPCGYDKFSYSWRSRKGTRFHDSIGKTYSRLVEDQSSSGYTTGDVLGFYISLPLLENELYSNVLPQSCKQMTLVKFKNHLYYEEKDNFSGSEKKLTPLKGSKIVFFKNGKSQGEAYTDIHQGVYYPAVSLYKNASAVINFGPTFKYPPSQEFSCKPISDLAAEKYVEHTLSDLVYHVAHEGTYEQ